MRTPRRVLTSLSTASVMTLVVPLVAACSITGPQAIGAVESQSVTPRIVFTARGTKQWSHLEAFGPVPVHQLKAGKTQCATLNHSGKTFSAQGFHSLAQTADGYPFEDGGFLCVQD